MKLFKNFYLNPTHKDGYRSECKKCGEKYSKDYENRRVKINHGLTNDIYNKMIKLQNGKCAICNKDQSEFKRPLFIDHNHNTKKIRALLCNNCNTILGHAKENINILINAIEYLKQYNI